MSDISRRGMLTGAAALAGAAACAGCAGSPAAARATTAKATTAPGTTAPATTVPATTSGSSAAAADGKPTGSLELHAGPLSAVPVGGATLVSVDGHDLILTQPTAGRPVVLVNRCPHAGCKVDVSGKQLVCPCHASTFGFDGKLAPDNAGPARQPLTEGKLRVENGQIIVEQA